LQRIVNDDFIRIWKRIVNGNIVKVWHDTIVDDEVGVRHDPIVDNEVGVRERGIVGVVVDGGVVVVECVVAIHWIEIIIVNLPRLI
jgi:hypothetical protein